MTDTNPNELLSIEGVKEVYGIPVGTLLRLGREGKGPLITKLDDRQQAPRRYRRKDVEDWLETRRSASITELIGK